MTSPPTPSAGVLSSAPAVTSPPGPRAPEPRVLCAGILVGDLFVPPLARLPAAGELLVTGDFLMQVGGCAANVAVALAKMGVGSRVVGRVGNDAFGDFLTSALTRFGVDVSFVRRSGTAGTSKTVILPVVGEDRRYVHTLGASAELTLQDVRPGAMAGVEVVYLGGYMVLPGLPPGAVVELFETAHRAGARTVLDVVLPGDTEASMDDLGSILSRVDYFLPNYDEARHLTGEKDPERQAALFSEAGAENVIITMGAEGLVVRTRTYTRHVAAPRVDVVDGSGAGDGFAAGLIVGMLERWPMERSLAFASEVGALACTALGCTDGIPDRQTVWELAGGGR
jgi:sugar/nucleoside kinase (ribokinase family)